MKRIAFFVEGLTEQYFVEKLIEEVLGKKNLRVEKVKMRGGRKAKPKISRIYSPERNDNAEYYFLIVDCGGETTVASYIKEQRTNLIMKGYVAIFGLLDVRPNFKRDEIDHLKKGLYYKMPTKDILVKFLLSIMEIEAWFLAEENHYKKISPDLTLEKLKTEFDFNPVSDTELIDEPSELLDSIYKLAGLRYNKKDNQIRRTVKSLDYENLYFEVCKRVPSLKDFFDSINNVI